MLVDVSKDPKCCEITKPNFMPQNDPIERIENEATIRLTVNTTFKTGRYWTMMKKTILLSLFIVSVVDALVLNSGKQSKSALPSSVLEARKSFISSFLVGLFFIKNVSHISYLRSCCLAPTVANGVEEKMDEKPYSYTSCSSYSSYSSSNSTPESC